MIFVFILFIVAIIVCKCFKDVKRNIDEIKCFEEEIEILKKNYISAVDKENLINKYKTLRKKIFYCRNDRIKNFVYFYDNINEKVEELNDIFVEKELKRCKRFFDKMFKYPIDEEQRKAKMD